MDEKYYEAEEFEALKFNCKTFENYSFIDCNFYNCTWEDCTLAHCSFSGCTFTKSTIISLKATGYSQIQNADFEDCQLIGVHWNELLPSGKFADPIKSLQNCHLKYNTFMEMNFKKFNFSGCDITETMFSECQLVESSFKSCNLERTEFFKNDIRKADFRNASGYQIELSSNKMNGARFSFPEVVHLLNGLGIKIDM